MSQWNKGTKIYVYLCHNASDGKLLALSSLKLVRDVVVEELPCSGKIDPRYILKAFETDARAVYMLTCPAGRCKSIEGNLRAARRIEVARELLCETGLDADSVQLLMPAGAGEAGLHEAVQDLARLINDNNANV